MEAVPGLKMVAETPPALRSLHGEVRRLQAALDAERFDKNFLQEELARTNLKLEKLCQYFFTPIHNIRTGYILMIPIFFKGCRP